MAGAAPRVGRPAVVRASWHIRAADCDAADTMTWPPGGAMAWRLPLRRSRAEPNGGPSDARRATAPSRSSGSVAAHDGGRGARLLARERLTARDPRGPAAEGVRGVCAGPLPAGGPLAAYQSHATQAAVVARVPRPRLAYTAVAACPPDGHYDAPWVRSVRIRHDLARAGGRLSSLASIRDKVVRPDRLARMRGSPGAAADGLDSGHLASAFRGRTGLRVSAPTSLGTGCCRERDLTVSVVVGRVQVRCVP